jgi:hypothetical protein
LGRGNAQLQIQTRSGTNRYAGSAVWNIRNSAVSANTWSNNTNVDPLTGQWKPTTPKWENNHQYTVSYGGPIVKNKTFFFALWDQQFNYQRDLVYANVMTNSARQGIFRYFEGWNPGNVLTPTNPATPIIASVDLAGNPVAPRTNPNGTAYTGGLRCFSVFGNVKFDGTPFTGADCPGGTALTNAVPWDTVRPTSDPTGYIRKILDKMPAPNYFRAAGDGLNLATFQWVQRRRGDPDYFGVLNGTAPLTDRKQINIKIDENFSARHRLSVNWSSERNDTETTNSTWPGALSFETARHPQVFTANLISVLSPNLLNESRFGLRHQNSNITAPWESDRSGEEASRYMIPGSNGYSALISLGVAPYAFGGTPDGVMNTAPSAWAGGTAPFYTYGDTLSWTVRKHALKLGAELRFPSSKQYNQAPAIGALPPRIVGGAGGIASTFSNAGLPNLPTNSRTGANSMIYFLAGSVNNASMLYWADDPSDVTNGVWQDFKSTGRKYRDYRSREWAAFWKDDWKVTHNFTLNLGLRYEYYGSIYVASGAGTTVVDQSDGLSGTFRSVGGNPFQRWLSPGNVYLTGYGPNVAAASALKCAAPGCDPNTLTTMEVVGPDAPNPGKRFIPADRNNFGPAVGFAWRLPWFGEGKTTVRGGYQLTYGGSFGETGIPTVMSETLIGASPGAASFATTNSSEFSGQYLDLRSVPLLVPVRPTSPAKPGQQVDIFAGSGVVHAYDVNYATPYVQNFNLSVTRTLARNLSVDVRYVGTVSNKQPSRINLNTPNVYHNPELFEALAITRAGGNAPLFDQIFAGVNLNNGTAGFGPVGTMVNGVLQTGSAHLRRNAAFMVPLANGDFGQVATLLSGNGSNMPAVGATGGLLNLPLGLTGVNGRLLRNGCDRIAAGQTTVGTSNPMPLRCFPEDYIRANPQFANSFLYTNAASSNYHSLQTQVMLRPTRGFTYMGTYTWSKNLGVPGLILAAVNTAASPLLTDPSDRRGDYTYTDGHRAHDFRSSGIFELPAGPGKLLFGNSSGWLARLVGGWQTGIILTMTSGARADISSSYLSGTTALPTGLYGSSVPDIVGPWSSDLQGHVRWNGDNNPARTIHGGSYFGSPNTFIKVADPQCAGVATADNLRSACTLFAVAVRNSDGSAGPIVLQNPKPGTRGNLGQNRVELPGTWSFDANLANTFRITDAGWIKSLQLRVDATNVLNHPTPGLPDLNINSSAPFGIITTKDGTRSFQGQLRAYF